MIIIKLAYRWFAEVSGDRICLVERQLEVWMRGCVGNYRGYRLLILAHPCSEVHPIVCITYKQQCRYI